MMHRQRGMTAIGFLLIAAVFAIVGFGVLKVAPIYMEHYKIHKLLKDIKVEWDGQNATPQQVRSSIEKRLNIESITGVHARDFSISRTDRGMLVEVGYESREPYVGNIHLLVVFDGAIEIDR